MIPISPSGFETDFTYIMLYLLIKQYINNVLKAVLIIIKF